MNPKQAAPPPPGITLWDVYYILFRHKWLIIILAVLAIVSAVLVKSLWPVTYESDAKLLIKYVKDARPPDQPGVDSQVTSPDLHGENIINSEIAILTSMDLVNTVVDSITPAKILAKAGGGSNRIEAAFLVEKGLAATVTNRTDVIDVVFSHPDPEMVQPVLSSVIENYLKRHTEIHRPEFNEYLIRETDTGKGKLEETEKELREAKAKAGVISFDDSKKSLGEMTARIQAEIYDNEAELAGYQETIKQLTDLLPKPDVASAPTNAASSSNKVAEASDREKADYLKICQQLNSLRTQEEALFQKGLTTNTSLVKTKENQIAGVETRKQQLEDKYPGLVNIRPVEAKSTSNDRMAKDDPKVRLDNEIIRAKALGTKIQTLTNQLFDLDHKASLMAAQEGAISQLQRDKANEEAELAYYQKRLDASRADEALGSGNSNIALVESPTPPSLSLNMKTLTKTVAMVLCGGLAFAFGLPFAIELFLDHSLKRPVEVQARLGLPFFISIPELSGNGKSRALKGAKKIALLAGKTEKTGKTAKAGKIEEAARTEEAGKANVGDQPPAPLANGHLALWEKSHALQPYFETLRDRLVTFFEMVNLTHKPKLVAVTSCREGAGVTTTAAGLASSLSEMGDGNVLLVNMNVRDGETHHFYRGKLACCVDEVLEKETRENALVQGNLYLAREHPEDDRLPRVLPKRFSHLVPRFKASDFDYIIFDMPPVSQISITPRLARFMDLVLLVIESEKTDRDVAKRASAMLSESKTNVGIVLNRNRSYVPRRLHQEL